MNRRDFYRLGTIAVSALVSVALAVPGVAYLLDPLFKRRSSAAEFEPLTSLSRLPVGTPESFSIVNERQDAWVKYPPEPVGTVWLVRQTEGSKTPVKAFSAECPHLGCAVNLSADRSYFFCPCHTSSFKFDGSRKNDVPPRGMDELEVKLSNDSDPIISVRFQRFRPQIQEKKPLV